MTLVASFWRSTAWVLTACVAVSAATYFWQGYQQHYWWSLDYTLSLSIPISLAVGLVWVAFVPRHLEFSDQKMTYRFTVRGGGTVPWTELKYWGPGNNVFLLQFEDRPTLKIFPRAYRGKDWWRLTAFLESRFPERKATLWFGGKGYRRRK